METLIRKNIKIIEETTSLTESDSGGANGTTILDDLGILQALRTVSEQDHTSSRTSSMSKGQRNPKRKHDATISADTDSVAADSPAAVPSPKVAVPGRLSKGAAPSRSGSVGAGREASVKPEEAEGAEYGKGNCYISHLQCVIPKYLPKGHTANPTREANEPLSRAKLTVGTEVFYKQPKKPNTEGEGILCTVTSVIGEGKQRRYVSSRGNSHAKVPSPSPAHSPDDYNGAFPGDLVFISPSPLYKNPLLRFRSLRTNSYEIVDADPDPPIPSLPYRASISLLASIPKTNEGLSSLLPKNKNVFALYPGTTTFYKAEVTLEGPDGKKGVNGETLKEGWVRLKFEGEEELDREMDVERRYVINEGAVKS